MIKEFLDWLFKKPDYMRSCPHCGYLNYMGGYFYYERFKCYNCYKSTVIHPKLYEK